MKALFRFKALILATSFTLVTSICSASSSGGASTGGADPLANDFLEYAKKIVQLIASNQIQSLTAEVIDLTLMNAEIEKIQRSLDDDKPLITFPDLDIISCEGAPKIGCNYGVENIVIARRGFKKLSLHEKYEVTALEFFKRQNVIDRYPKARLIANFVMEKSCFQIEGRVRVCPDSKVYPTRRWEYGGIVRAVNPMKKTVLVESLKPGFEKIVESFLATDLFFPNECVSGICYNDKVYPAANWEHGGVVIAVNKISGEVMVASLRPGWEKYVEVFLPSDLSITEKCLDFNDNVRFSTP